MVGSSMSEAKKGILRAESHILVQEDLIHRVVHNFE